MKIAKDPFIGAWQVREAVFTPAGDFLGVVQQKRRLLQMGEKGIRVLQHCQPEPALHGTPMGDFSGDFEFVIEKRGCHRLYRGPDVQGFGIEFCAGFLWGQGVWPRFGRNFRSWSVMVDEERQLTGGTFYSGETIAAVMMGVARPEGIALPALSHTDWQAMEGEGEAFLTRDQGHVVSTLPCKRSVRNDGSWIDMIGTEEQHFKISQHQGGLQIIRNERDVGMACRYDSMIHWQVFGEDGSSSLGLDILSPWGDGQIAIRQETKFGSVSCLVGLKLITQRKECT